MIEHLAPASVTCGKACMTEVQSSSTTHSTCNHSRSDQCSTSLADLLLKPCRVAGDMNSPCSHEMRSTRATSVRHLRAYQTTGNCKRPIRTPANQRLTEAKDRPCACLEETHSAHLSRSLAQLRQYVWRQGHVRPYTATGKLQLIQK